MFSGARPYLVAVMRSSLTIKSNLQTQMPHERTEQPPVDGTIISDPSDDDVCFGRGKGCYRRPANLLVQAVVSTFKKDYQRVSAGKMGAKTEIVRKVYQQLSHLRFLKPLGKKKNAWVVASPQEVMRKLAHLLRWSKSTKEAGKRQRELLMSHAAVLAQQKEGRDDRSDRRSAAKSGEESSAAAAIPARAGQGNGENRNNILFWKKKKEKDEGGEKTAGATTRSKKNEKVLEETSPDEPYSSPRAMQAPTVHSMDMAVDPYYGWMKPVASPHSHASGLKPEVPIDLTDGERGWMEASPRLPLVHPHDVAFMEAGYSRFYHWGVSPRHLGQRDFAMWESRGPPSLHSQQTMLPSPSSAWHSVGPDAKMPSIKTMDGTFDKEKSFQKHHRPAKVLATGHLNNDARPSYRLHHYCQTLKA